VPAPRLLAVVYTDLVASTETVARLGLTLKKSRAGRESRTGPTSPVAARPGDGSNAG